MIINGVQSNSASTENQEDHEATENRREPQTQGVGGLKGSGKVAMLGGTREVKTLELLRANTTSF